MEEGNVFLRGGFERARATRTSKTMTIGGTSVKTVFLLIILMISSSYTWSLLSNGNAALASRLAFIGVIGSLVLALTTCFVPKIASITSILYAVFEGLAIGSVSYYADSWYPGVVLPAIMLTIATALAVMMIYKAMGGVSDRFRRIITVAVMGIGISYLLTFILSIFGIRMSFMHSSGPLGIGISLVVVFIAASSLLLDYDFVYNASRYGAPKYMEWYGAFSILVTLVWMYLEILRLLEKIRGND
ncbi:MAG: Bax inhibitor-1/YccA family protein [Clostridium sp.]